MEYLKILWLMILYEISTVKCWWARRQFLKHYDSVMKKAKEIGIEVQRSEATGK